MDETEAKFELLKQEMQAVQQGIRALDTTSFAIKGWCVTLSAAIAGVAATKDRPLLLLIGFGVALAFWLLDAHYKAVQRVYIRRDLRMERVLKGADVLALLSSGRLRVPGMASRFTVPRRGSIKKLTFQLVIMWREAKSPFIFNLYLLIGFSLIVEMVVLYLT
jgi:hypothetical protein